MSIITAIINRLRAVFSWENPTVKTSTKTAGAAVSIAAAMALVMPWEGLRLKSYQDIVGVWTACYGETQGVRAGQTYTKAQCDEKLKARLAEFDTALRRCISAQMPDAMRGALVSWAYNVGTGAACGSTLALKANAGDLVGACNELPKWNKAGGRVVQGLVNRRADERAACLTALQ